MTVRLTAHTISSARQTAIGMKANARMVSGAYRRWGVSITSGARAAAAAAAAAAEVEINGCMLVAP